MSTIAVIGAHGTIASALIDELACKHQIIAVSRTHVPSSTNVQCLTVEDYTEDNIEALAQHIDQGSLDAIIVATGFLHDKSYQPEKNLEALSSSHFLKSMEANCLVPMLFFKYLIPKLKQHSLTLAVALSARVGSISDNRLGGWYSYRSSKAALNMMIKNTAIQLKRQKRQTCVIALHPGTVFSPLSSPFKKQNSQWQQPQQCAQKLVKVLINLELSDSGKIFDHNAKEIQP
ncbi:SDR family NAD(P)-dependent oxidoreductase [Paraferrimonas sp. SM1919]|uniref:SDR family NAD(P)-dependent oxidoreductase n=1 Tax=Paraferrimonas sp. SM1919 TaxID=2662263 RepID=UPI0013D433CA|nr:SDR family NAD(P)-dependent oxidoreductase [Paraferrimonas sp. SM1919]